MVLEVHNAPLNNIIYITKAFNLANELPDNLIEALELESLLKNFDIIIELGLRFLFRFAIFWS